MCVRGPVQKARLVHGRSTRSVGPEAMALADKVFIAGIFSLLGGCAYLSANVFLLVWRDADWYALTLSIVGVLVIVSSCFLRNDEQV